MRTKKSCPMYLCSFDWDSISSIWQHRFISIFVCNSIRSDVSVCTIFRSVDEFKRNNEHTACYSMYMYRLRNDRMSCGTRENQKHTEGTDGERQNLLIVDSQRFIDSTELLRRYKTVHWNRKMNRKIEIATTWNGNIQNESVGGNGWNDGKGWQMAGWSIGR